MDCNNCDPKYFPYTPDTAVVYTGPNDDELGIRSGDSWYHVGLQLVRAAKSVMALTSGSRADVQAEDVVATTPPGYLLGDYAKCWDLVGDKRGKYGVDMSFDKLMFSYDFQDVVASVPAPLRITGIEVVINVTENGVQRNYTNTNKAANSFVLARDQYPLTFKAKIYVDSAECGKFSLEKVLTVGSVVTSLGFYFEPVGSDGVALGRAKRFTQADMNKLQNAKMSKINNLVEDMVSANYGAVVMQMKVKMEEIMAQIAVPQKYTIGTGIGAQQLELAQVLELMYSDIRKMIQKVEAIEEAQRRSAQLS